MKLLPLIFISTMLPLVGTSYAMQDSSSESEIELSDEGDGDAYLEELKEKLGKQEFTLQNVGDYLTRLDALSDVKLKVASEKAKILDDAWGIFDQLGQGTKIERVELEKIVANLFILFKLFESDNNFQQSITGLLRRLIMSLEFEIVNSGTDLSVADRVKDEIRSFLPGFIFSGSTIRERDERRSIPTLLSTIVDKEEKNSNRQISKISNLINKRNSVLAGTFVMMLLLYMILTSAGES